MSMPALPLFLRLLRHRRNAVAVFVGLYGLGLGVFLVVDGLWRRVETDLGGRSRELLESDLQIESRRPLSSAESLTIRSALPTGTREATSSGFLSMVAGPGGQSRLVQIKAVDSAYPLFGSFQFDPARSPGFTLRDWRRGEVLAPPALLAALGLQVGDSLAIGGHRFLLRAAYTERPGGGFDLWELGGRLYMHYADMAITGLDQYGSRIFRYRFFAFPDGVDANALRRQLEKSLDDPEIDIRSVGDRDSDLGRLLDNVGGFLKILAMGAYLLAAIGATFFFSRHLEAERPRAALLRTLGCTPTQVRRTFWLQCLALALLSSLFGLLLALAVLQALLPWVKAVYGLSLSGGLPLPTWVLGFVLPGVTAILFGAAELWRLGSTSPALLLRPGSPQALPWRWRLLLSLLQAVGVLFFARWISHSWLLGSASLGVLVAAWALMMGLGYGLVQALWRGRSRLGYADRVLLGAMHLRPGRSLTAFFALGFTAFAIALLPLLRHSLAEELRAPRGQALPSLFLFDIQEEENQGLQALLAQLGNPLETLSPMVRARLQAINGRGFRRDDADVATLEDKARSRLRNRGFNLSYRDRLLPSENVTSGTFWTSRAPESLDSLPQISVEREFAAKLNLALGDTLLFDVQGVEISGRITSLRRVRWNSFRPNFFVLFQPGALEAAPKTFLGTVVSPTQAAAGIRDRVTRAYPHVSVMEVGEALRRLDQLMAQLQRMVALLSWGYLLIGLCILATVIEGTLRDSRRSLLLLRSLGATEPTLRLALLRHYLAFALAATLGGLALAVGTSFAIHTWLWDIAFSPPLEFFPAGLLSGLAVGLIAAAWAMLRGRGGSLRDLLASTRGD